MLEATRRYRGGSGAPLVLIHAGWTSWRLWTPLLGALSARRDVLAPTLPGHLGGPELPVDGRVSIGAFADAVERELDLAGFECPDVVGNSIGGWTALELARRGRARRVVAIAPMGMQDAAKGRALERHYSLVNQVARVGRVPLLTVFPPARRVLLGDMMVRGDRLSAELARHLLDAFVSCDVGALFRATRGPGGAMPQIERAQEITAPVLLIWGDRDSLATRDQMDRYLTALPRVRGLELPGLAHCPQLDQPERISEEILRFCEPPPGA